MLAKAWAASTAPWRAESRPSCHARPAHRGTDTISDELDQLAAALPLERTADADEIASIIVVLAFRCDVRQQRHPLPVDSGRTAVQDE